ncbi:MAG: DUF456 domain-containing protein [Bacillota bacterium]
MSDIIAIIIVSIFFLASLVGTVLPMIPEAPFMVVGIVIYGLIAGFDELSLYFFIGQIILALAIIGVDYLTTAIGSQYFGGSKAAMWGSVVGLLVGLLFFPIGLLIGPFLGAALAEFFFGRRTDQAIRSGVGASLGFWFAFPLKLILKGIMIGWFFTRIL